MGGTWVRAQMSIWSRSCQHHVNYTCMNGQRTAPDADFLCASSCEPSTPKSSGELADMDARRYSRHRTDGCARQPPKE